MAAPSKSRVYTFPPDFDVRSFSEKTDKICVVALIGKSRFAPFYSKASILNPVLDRDIYQGIESVAGEYIEKGYLECYYDGDSQVLYLHVLSHMDASELVRHCSQLTKTGTDEDFYTYWQDAEFQYAKVLLLVFSLSHIVLLVHPNCSFDMSYIKLFRVLDIIRAKLLPATSDMLRELPVSKEWMTSGRLCSPRVLFYFNSHSAGPYSSSDDDTVSKSRSQKISPIKRLQHNLEDQIYGVLRRARIITNISNNSLFAVPANQEFVFINSRKNETVEPVTCLLSLLRNHFTGQESPRTKSYHISRRGNLIQNSSSSESIQSPRTCQENSFKEFLWQHVEIAFGKGFDDNVGRNHVVARFELPAASLWFMVLHRIYDQLFDYAPQGRTQSSLILLRNLLDPDLRFSESRCSKIITMAEAAYQQDLPAFYVTAYHRSKLVQAKRVFSQYARGPAFDKYMAQLEESCEEFWTNGRQQCEAISLSGNLCVNQLHRALCDAVTDATKQLPVMAHCSQLKTKATCNCGQQQAEKDDPFDHRSANYDFYMTLEAGCCGTLQHIDMPTFRPSTSQVTAAATPTSTTLDIKDPSKDSNEGGGGDNRDMVTGLSTLSLALSLGQSGGCSDLFHNENLPDVELEVSQHEAQLSQSMLHPPPTIEETNEEMDITEEDNDHFEEKDKEEITTFKDHEADAQTEECEVPPGSHSTTISEGSNLGTGDLCDAVTALKILSEGPQRQHSTTEYLPGMLHSNCQSGLLPKFPSWSLCCLHSASLYNHQQGLDLPGFLPGSNFLLPWELCVRAESERWPTIIETTSKRGKHPRRTSVKSQSEPVENIVRVFIGMEYECSRGHRFFCSAPDKVIKVLGNCSVKDTASRLVNMDMPLYTTCHLHSPKGFLAQMMRVYIVTPEAPVQILLQPKVRPGPSPCPVFFPGVDEIPLPPGGIWVLRLPQIYMGDNGPISVPSDPQNLHSCVMLKGLFAYKELSADG